MRPTISVVHTSNSKKFQDRLKRISRQAVYVGIPATTAEDRQKQLIKMASGTKSIKKRTKLIAASASTDLNNAELLYIFSKGSPANHQPARPVIEPAIAADGNREAISFELAEANKAELDGRHDDAMRFLKRAGIAGSNASKKWFTDSRNEWPPNAPRTIAEKGSDRPGIDTAAMQGAITYVTKEDTDE